jgi:hypothetical protein
MRLRLLLAGVGLLLLGTLVMVFGLVNWTGAPGVRDEQMHAERVWYAQSRHHYRIVIRQRTRTGVCEQDLEIRNDRVQTVYQNQCAQPPIWTVPRLFSWVRQLGQPAGLCYPSSLQCTCRVSTHLQVLFDPQSGYPRQVLYEWGLRPNWESMDYWQSLVLGTDRVDCARRTRGGGVVEITVVSFMPLS